MAKKPLSLKGVPENFYVRAFSKIFKRRRPSNVSLKTTRHFLQGKDLCLQPRNSSLHTTTVRRPSLAATTLSNKASITSGRFFSQNGVISIPSTDQGWPWEWTGMNRQHWQTKAFQGVILQPHSKDLCNEEHWRKPRKGSILLIVWQQLLSIQMHGTKQHGKYP